MILCNNSINTHNLSRLLASILLASYTPCVLANNTLTQKNTNHDAPTHLDDLQVTVTSHNKTSLATKTENDLKDIPQTIHTTTAHQIKKQHSHSLTDVMSRTAGVAQDNSAGNRAERFLLRGFVSTAYSTDGFVINPTLDRSEGFLDLADVAQVEVLKGPSSVLFGRSNAGGVINISTKQPTDYLSADATVSLGSFDTKQLSGSISSALDEAGKVKGRLSASVKDAGEFRKNAPDTEHKLLSGTLSYEADKLTLSSTTRYIDQHTPFIRGLPADGKAHKNPIELGLAREAFYAEPWSKSHTQKFSLTTHAQYNFDDSLAWKNSLLLAKSKIHDTGIDYRGIKGDTLRRRYNDRTEKADNVNLTSELVYKFNTQHIAHELLVGTDLAKGQLHFVRKRGNLDAISLYQPTQGTPMSDSKLDRDHEHDATTVGVYLQDQLALGSRLKMLVGTRFDHAKDKVVSAFADDKENNYQKTDKTWSSRIGAVYTLNPSVNVYGNYSEGFMPNKGADKAGVAFDAEKSRSYEMGVKFNHKPSHLSGLVSAFYINKYNVKTQDPTDEEYSVTTGKQTSQGLEVELKYRPTSQFDLSANIAYTDAKISKDNLYAVGSGLINVPKTQGSLWANYRFDERLHPKLDGLELGMGLTYMGKRLGSMISKQDSEHYHLPAYTTVDVGASYPLSDTVSVRLSAKNIFDKYYLISGADADENQVGKPRNYLLSVNFNY